MAAATRLGTTTKSLPCQLYQLSCIGACLTSVYHLRKNWNTSYQAPPDTTPCITMSGRILKLGGVLAAGGAGWYLYKAGGDPKAAEKRFEGPYLPSQWHSRPMIIR